MKLVLELPQDLSDLADLVKITGMSDDVRAKMLELISSEIAKHQLTDLGGTPHSIEIQLNGKLPKEPDSDLQAKK